MPGTELRDRALQLAIRHVAHPEAGTAAHERGRIRMAGLTEDVVDAALLDDAPAVQHQQHPLAYVGYDWQSRGVMSSEARLALLDQANQQYRESAPVR